MVSTCGSSNAPDGNLNKIKEEPMDYSGDVEVLDQPANTLLAKVDRVIMRSLMNGSENREGSEEKTTKRLSNSCLSKKKERTVRSPDLRFTSSLGKVEEKRVIWEISDVRKFMDLREEEMEESGMAFDAGEEVGVEASWKFFFQPVKPQEGSEAGVTSYLKLLSVKSPVNERAISVWHSVSISSGGSRVFVDPLKRDFLQVGGCRGWAEMFRKAIILEQTSGTDAMEVELKLKIYANEGFKPAAQEGASLPNLSLKRRGLEDQRSHDFEGLLQSGELADLEITARQLLRGKWVKTTRKAHKVIFKAKSSSVFAKMFAKDSTAVEAKTGKLVIDNMSSKGLNVFLHFIYTRKVLDDWLQVPGEILSAADKYGLGKLKQFFGYNLISAITPSNAQAMYKVANRCNLSFAKSAIMEFISRNMAAVLDSEDSRQEL